MSSTGDLAEVLIASFSLAVLVIAVAVTDVANEAFIVLAVAAAVLYLACYVAPGLMRRIISVPQAFHLSQNWGATGFDTQAVSYSSYHTTTLAAITHTGFVLDATAWLVLATHYLGWYGVVAILAVKTAQIVSYGEPRLAIVLGGMWVGIAVAAGAVWTFLDDATAAMLAAATVVVMAIWRTIGHISEPVPPGVSGTSRFVPLEDVGLRASLGVSFVVGIVAEFASGIPFRLVDVWAYDVPLRQLGFRADRLVAYLDLDRQREAIFDGGWAAAPTTAHLADPQFVA